MTTTPARSSFHLKPDGADLALAVPVEADRAVVVTQHSVESIEAATHLLLDGGQALGEGGGQAVSTSTSLRCPGHVSGAVR
jgi:hypothetical protein